MPGSPLKADYLDPIEGSCWVWLLYLMHTLVQFSPKRAIIEWLYKWWYKQTCSTEIIFQRVHFELMVVYAICAKLEKRHPLAHFKASSINVALQVDPSKSIWTFTGKNLEKLHTVIQRLLVWIIPVQSMNHTIVISDVSYKLFWIKAARKMVGKLV